MRSTLTALVLIALVAGPAHAALAKEKLSGPLDGKVFIVDAAEKGTNAKNPADAIQFKDGMFYSASCEAWGFGWGAYTSKLDNGVLYIEMTTSSPVEGVMRWKGHVKGDQIEGSFVWSKAGQRDIEYGYKGALKKK